MCAASQAAEYLRDFRAKQIASSSVQWSTGTEMICSCADGFTTHGLLTGFPTDIAAAVVHVFAAHGWNLTLQVAASPPQIPEDPLVRKPASRDVLHAHLCLRGCAVRSYFRSSATLSRSCASGSHPQRTDHPSLCPQPKSRCIAFRLGRHACLPPAHLAARKAVVSMKPCTNAR